MADILFGQSYYLRFDPKLWQAMQPYPPLGCLYAAALLREQGYNVALFDAMLAESEAEWQAALQKEQPKTAVIYEDSFNYLSKMCLLRMRQAAFTMIEMARAQNCTVIVCGSDATDHAEAYLAHGAHYVLLGEGEQTLLEVMSYELGVKESLSSSLSTIHYPLSTIQGLAYVDGNGRCQRNPRRPDMRDLDSLPFPAWDLVDVPRYRQIWLTHHGYYSMNSVTTRGCPYHCNWCAKPIWGQRYNSRSPQNVAAEMKWLHDTYQPDHIWFADDIMGLKPGWLEAFADALEVTQTRIPFKCLSRADLLLRGDTIHALRRAGCQIVWMGAESGSQKILNAMEKGTQVTQIFEAAEKLHAAGVNFAFFLQFGYPGENRADIEATLQMVRDCRPHDIGMSVSYPLPGTKFFEKVKIELGEKQNWQDSSDLEMLYHGPFTTAFYRHLHHVLHLEFRAQKEAEALQNAWHSRQFRPAHLRQALSWLYRRARLPLARLQLDRLARIQHPNVPALVPELTLEEAARPSLQE